MPKKELHLQPRLQALADWITPGCRLADVGTDHGYLPVYLLQRGLAAFAIAADINAAPLEHARRTAAEYEVSGLEFRLCDGLAAVSEREVDTVVIAGMGGETIAAILSAAPWTALGDHRLLLQPMTRPELLRSWLYEQGYHICDERLVEDKGLLYPILDARGGREAAPSAARLHSGVKLTNDPLWGRYLTQRMEKLRLALEGLERSSELSAQGRGESLRTLLAELESLRGEWTDGQNR